jgi:hypothetical protein
MMRFMTIALAVLLAIGVPVTSARAAAEWCDTDPMLLIVTPEGQVVPVYVLISALGVEHLPTILAASIVASSYSADDTRGGRATRVTVTVEVPDDHFASGFPIRAAVSTGPLGTGTIYAAVEGTSGAPMTMRFTLPVP